jgi:serine/threonine protein kinase
MVAKIGDLETIRKVDNNYKPLTLSITYKYAAPEQLWGYLNKTGISNRPLTTACDIYSFGVLLWEMVMGSMPWKNFGYEEIQIKQCCADTTFINENGKTKNEEVDVIIEMCCKKEPKERPTAEILLKKLEN